MDTAAFPSPCFILDEDKLRANLRQLQALSKEHKISILLALKGFAYWYVFPWVAQYLQGAAASSLHEARLAYEEMGYRAHVYMPAYMESEYKELLSYATHMSFNSLAQYRQYGPSAQQAGVSVGLRIQPDCSSAPRPLYDPAARGSRFGVSADELAHGLPDGIEGMHIHALCQADSYALERVLAAAEARFGHFFQQLQWLNIGGGIFLQTKAMMWHTFRLL